MKKHFKKSHFLSQKLIFPCLKKNISKKSRFFLFTFVHMNVQNFWHIRYYSWLSPRPLTTASHNTNKPERIAQNPFFSHPTIRILRRAMEIPSEQNTKNFSSYSIFFQHFFCGFFKILLRSIFYSPFGVARTM